MATIRTTLCKDHYHTKAPYPVIIRVSHKGKKHQSITGFEATEKEFIEGRFVQGKGFPKFYVYRTVNGNRLKYDNKEANGILFGLEQQISKIIDGYKEAGIQWDMETLKDDLHNKPKRSIFYQFAEDTIEHEHLTRGAYQRAGIVRQSLDSFIKYDSQFKEKQIQEITPKYIQGYINFCSNSGHSDATIAIRLREVRRLFNIAIRDGVIGKDAYPFSSGSEDNRVKIPKAEIKKADQYLPTESLIAMSEAKGLSKILDKTRHIFLFSFYCRGINWKDMALLTSEDMTDAIVTDETTRESRQVKLLQYKRSKTKGEFNIQVSSDIQRELDWFKANTKLYKNHLVPIILEEVGPSALDTYLKQSRKRFNKSLKILTSQIGLPPSQQDITIYTARHSFAMAMQSRNKSVEIISQALGHQSVETTKHYLAKFSTTKMADETSNLLEEKEKKTQEPTLKNETSGQQADRILKLSDLVSKGLLTEEEFLKLKSEILLG